MTPDQPPAEPQAEPQPNWAPLDAHERRVMGVLAEKQKTTPDAYPMSVNALVTGCNQRSNRDPLMNLTDVEVEDVLARVQKKGLAVRLTGSRVEKWRHLLYEQWRVNKAEMAVLIELLLRGPQTEGELRGRVSRMEPLDDLEALRALLKPMAERKLVVYLSPEGRRGTTVTHGFHEPHELARLRAAVPEEPAPAPAAVTTPQPPGVSAELLQALEVRLQESQGEVGALRAEVGELREAVADLAAKLQQVREGLGL
jgi:uncharacterized protein YceH (UPF0502 family)